MFYLLLIFQDIKPTVIISYGLECGEGVNEFKLLLKKILITHWICENCPPVEKPI